ncbi:MAG: NAD(P)/FAD-dependent oxidoreductase [Sphingomonadales bacterium]
MKTEFLLVGQGLCGTWLSYFLEQEKREFLVLDPGHLPNASKQAGGLINPVTGRRLVTTWLIDELLPFAHSRYDNIAQLLFEGQTAAQHTLIEERPIIQFFSHPDTRSIFEKRASEQTNYLLLPQEEVAEVTPFDRLHGHGIIQGGYQVRPDLLLTTYKKQLLQTGRLIEQKFEYDRLSVQTGTRCYEDIAFDYLIFCDGIGLHHNSLFGHLPVAPIKGEALIIDVPELPSSYVYKGPLTMIPLGDAGHWWVGSSYEWNFTDPHPSPSFRTAVEQTLQQWLKLPFSVVDHWAAIRPGSKERRPFVGMLEKNPAIGLLGGMGTKGCSLAPYFANQLVQHLLYRAPLHPEADLNRFKTN